MNVYNLELVRNNEIPKYVTHKRRTFCLLLTCYFIWHFFFFITLMFVYLQKLLHCLIIYSYKTNSSFLLCPLNLRSIGPSNFKYTAGKIKEIKGRRNMLTRKWWNNDKIPDRIGQLCRKSGEKHLECWKRNRDSW